MNKGTELIVPILFVVGSYIALPAIMISGWVRWAKRRTPRTLSGIFSLTGFILGTTSGLLAISSILYALMIGGFPYYDPFLLRIYRWGGLLSLAGIAFAISGAWRPNPLRWYAPACAAGTLLFWFMAATGE
jgi:hypothetical protein